MEVQTMPRPTPTQEEVLDAIRSVAAQLGRPPSRREFQAGAGVSEYHVLNHFPSWREAVHAAGLERVSF